MEAGPALAAVAVAAAEMVLVVAAAEMVVAVAAAGTPLVVARIQLAAGGADSRSVKHRPAPPRVGRRGHASPGRRPPVGSSGRSPFGQHTEEAAAGVAAAAGFTLDLQFDWHNLLQCIFFWPFGQTAELLFGCSVK